MRLTRTGRAVRLVHDNGAAATADGADIALVKLIVRAREWWQRTPYARGLVCALIWLVRHFPRARTPLFRMILALANGSLTEAEVADWFRAVLT